MMVEKANRRSRLGKKAAADGVKNRKSLSPEEARQALHELRVHQIEIEMQNEELRRAHAELDAVRARYFDLYDLAPVGYFVLSGKGLILEVNLTAATMLGEKRETLAKQPITRFILKEDQDLYYQHLKQLLEKGAPQIFELKLARGDGSLLWAQLEATAAQDPDGAPVCRVVLSDITERKQAEEKNRTLLAAVQNEKTFLSTLIDSIADEVWFANSQGKFTLANSAALKEFALDPDRPIEVEALAKKLEVFRPDGSPRPVEEAPPLRALSGEVVRNLEEIVRTPASSELRYRQVNAAPVRDSLGNIIGAVSVVRDITERKLAELKLEKTLAEAKRFRDALDHVSAHIYIKDTQSRYVYANRPTLQLFGCSAEELAGCDDARFFPPDTVKRLREVDLRVLGGERTSEEIDVVDAGGGRRVYWEVKTPIFAEPEGRTIWGLLGISTDITERKRAEEEHLSLSMRQEAILASIPDIIMEVNKEKAYTWANPAGLEFFGDDVIGKEAADYFIGEQETYAIVAPLFNGRDEVFYLESWQRRKDGEPRLLAWWCRVLKDAEETVTGALSTAHDITERMRAELLERAIYDIARAPETATSLDDLFHSIHLIIKGLMPAGNFYVALYDDKEDLIRFPYFVDEIDASPPPIKPGKGLTEYVLRTGGTLLCDATLDEELTRRGEVDLVGAPAACWLGAPLKAGERVIGVVALQHYSDPKAYGEREKKILDFVSGQIAKTIERKLAEEAVEASLREKEILLREIHHRVKNNMQVISSLFNLQSGHIKDENARRMLKEGQLRIRSMALVHEKLYQSPDLSKIDFGNYLRSLADHIFQFFRVKADRIRLETHLEDVPLDINSAVPCGLLVTELITNALKHAFPGDRKGVVGIGLYRREDGFVELRVADDGVGFPEALDFRLTESLGLQIVTLLVDQLEGTIELDRERGTEFTVVFRESVKKART